MSGNTITLTGTPGAFTVAAMQAGDGIYDAAPVVLQSSSVMGGSTYAHVFSGPTSFHVLGVRSDGTLWAWGFNTNGQLGDGTTTQRTSLVQVGVATDWQTIAAGQIHTVAIRSDGTLWSWGYNLYGQLGLGTNDSSAHSTPVQVGSATNWKAVAAGAYSTLALKTDGSLWAWGDNNFGQLGLGTSDNFAHGAPVQVGSGADWKSIARGAYSNRALKTDGTLWSWGNNSYGQLGDGTDTPFRTSPSQIGTSTAWSTLPLLSYSSHSMAMTSGGTLWGCGPNSNGQLAGAGRNQSVPNYVQPALTPQTLNFGALPALVAGNTVALDATASSGLPVSFIVSGPGTVTGNQLALTGVGAVTVIAYQPGDSFWQTTDISVQPGTVAAPVAPNVTTVAATLITSTGAKLNGSVDANNASTTDWST